MSIEHRLGFSDIDVERAHKLTVFDLKHLPADGEDSPDERAVRVTLGPLPMATVNPLSPLCNQRFRLHAAAWLARQ